MTLEEMREKKREYGFTNEQISDYTGVPLATVQKIFAGVTESPRYATLQALETLFRQLEGERNPGLAADRVACSLQFPVLPPQRLPPFCQCGIFRPQCLAASVIGSSGFCISSLLSPANSFSCQQYRLEWLTPYLFAIFSALPPPAQNSTTASRFCSGVPFTTFRLGIQDCPSGGLVSSTH